MKKSIAFGLMLFALGYGVVYLGASFAMGEWMPSILTIFTWQRETRLLVFVWALICFGISISGALDEKLKEKIRDSSER